MVKIEDLSKFGVSFDSKETIDTDKDGHILKTRTRIYSGLKIYGVGPFTKEKPGTITLEELTKFLIDQSTVREAEIRRIRAISKAKGLDTLLFPKGDVV